jgi:polysaccharide pyruvyl transferase WcaK-like protein
MRIGILTHHYVKNYGAFLQMKAMYETLRRLYPKAEIVVVNYVNPRHWRKNIIHILHFRFGIDTPATYIKKIQQLQTFTKYEHTIPRTHSVKSAEEIATLKLDLIVLGSDEIWNLCGSGYHPLKFGTGLEEQQTIAYAPSVGAVTKDTEVPAEVASGLKNIDRISGRDTETVKFIERVSGRNAEKMLDPTFLYNFDANIKKDNIQPKPYKYILIYDCKLTPSMVEELKQYAQNNSLKIIGAGDYKTYYDEGFINLSPYEWVDLFRNAEKIITGTFHGTVFSIKYEKPVVCYPTEKNRINKIHSLLEDMKIPSRLLEIGREKELINMLNKPMNYMQTQEYIARKVQEADEFLVGEKR